MGEKLVGANRLCHSLLILVADIALGCMVFTAVLFLVNRFHPGRWPAWAEQAPNFLLTLAPYTVAGPALRFYVRPGVDFACNHFPHDAEARECAILLFDLLALISGAVLLSFGLGRMSGTSAAASWAWWRALPFPLAGLTLVFDSLLFLTGLMPHGEAYAGQRVPAYQRKLRRTERLRRLREEERALQAPDSVPPEQMAGTRESLWRGMGRALPSHSARLYLLNKQE